MTKLIKLFDKTIADTLAAQGYTYFTEPFWNGVLYVFPYQAALLEELKKIRPSDFANQCVYDDTMYF